MNSTITEMKNTLEGINSKITEAEARINDLEDRMVEFTATEQNKDSEYDPGPQKKNGGKDREDARNV